MLANEEPRLDVLLSTKEEEEDDDKENGETTEKRKERAQIEIWDVERLGILFEKDDEFAFFVQNRARFRRHRRVRSRCKLSVLA